MKHLDPDTAMTERLSALVQTLSLEITPSQAQLLVAHLGTVLSANARLNLTRITEPEAALRLHVVDSLVCLPEIYAAPEGEYADLGSGAGFPGIPLAVMTERPSLLIESVRKKASFLDGAVEELGLFEHVSVYPGRGEALARESGDRFAVVTARAVSSLASLVELASPLLVRDGTFVALKGAPDAEEVERGDRVAEVVGMDRETLRRVTLPDGDEVRTIVSYRKTGEAEIQLPRADGRAQSRPLG